MDDLSTYNAITTVESIAVKIKQRIVAEPASKVVLYKMLAYCKDPKSFLEVNAEVLAYPEMKGSLQTVHVLLAWLIDCEGIKEIVQNEKPSLWVTTEAGVLVVQKENEGDKLETLFLEDQKYQTIYLSILQLCKDAKSRKEIEDSLSDNSLLENPKIYPSYFIDALERAGGLLWNGYWKTTPKAYTKL